MKTYGGVEAYLHALTSAIEGSEWSASRFGRFIPREGGLHLELPGTFNCGSYCSVIKCKGKVFICLTKYHAMKGICLPKHHAMKAYWGSGDTTARLLGPNINTILKNPQSMSLLQNERPSFTPIQHNWQNYSFV
jgi:hypothetical protein